MKLVCLILQTRLTAATLLRVVVVVVACVCGVTVAARRDVIDLRVMM